MSHRKDGLSSARVREANERSIIAAIRQGGAMTKSQLARELDLTRQALNTIVSDMLAAGLLRVGGRKTGSVGRSSVYYAIDPSAAFAIGMVLEVGRVEALLVDFLGAVHYRATIAGGIEHGGPSAAALESVAAAIRSHCAAAALRLDRIVGLGAILPDTAFTRFPHENEKPDEMRLPLLQARLQNAFGMPVHMGRRAMASAMAEHLKAEGALPDSLIFISFAADSRLSAALLLNETVHGGAHGSAMQLGRMPVPSGAPGEAPALETIASLGALHARLAEAGIAGEDLYAANLARPDIVEDWIATAGDALGGTLALLQMAIDAGAVVFDVELPGTIVHRLIERIGGKLGRILPPGTAAPQILRSRLGRDSALLGAAMLPLNARFSHPAASRGARSPGAIPENGFPTPLYNL